MNRPIRLGIALAAALCIASIAAFAPQAFSQVCPTITVEPDTLPNGEKDVPYSATVTASGGSAPYTFTANFMPYGLTLASNGEISGTPISQGSYPFTVTARDNEGCEGQREYTVFIRCPDITVLPETLPDGEAGQAYSVTLTATPAEQGPYTFDSTQGDLPPGLTLASNGVLSGTPTATGSFTFLVGAVNADTDCSNGREYTVVIQSPSGPRLSISDVSGNEGNNSTFNLNFVVSVSPVSAQTITVAYATVNGSASTVDNDYVSASGTLTIPANTVSRTVTVRVRGDTKYESNETFQLVLSSPANATILDGQGVGTIVNDDAAPPVIPAISIADANVLEGNNGNRFMDFTVTLSQATTRTVSMTYATQGVSATTADRDFTAASGTLSIASGRTTGTIRVQVRGDARVESDETFQVNLSNPGNATIADGQGIGTIRNDDGLAARRVGVGASEESEESSAEVPASERTSIAELHLEPAIPNPTPGAMRIGFAMPRESEVRLSVIDVQGRETAVLARGLFPAGRHEATWDGRASGSIAPSGVYFVRCQVDEEVRVRRFLIAR